MHSASRGRRGMLPGVAMVVAFVVGGCDERLAGGLDEPSANAILAALDAHGLGGTKRKEGGAEAGFEVLVDGRELGSALRVLSAEGLPRRDEPGVEETYASSGLVPTASEERARFLAATTGEIAATLERLDGVVDARVHVALPDARDAPLDGTPASARASVLLRVRRGARIEAESVRRLVAGAIEGLDPASVAVVVAPGAAFEVGPSPWVRFGPIRVARGSAPLLRGVLSVSLALHVVFASVLVFVVARTRRRLERQALEASPAE